MLSKTSVYVMIMMGVFAIINLFLIYYYIFVVKGLMWMGFVSLFAAGLLISLMIKYYKQQKKKDFSNINAHIKSEEDRILK
ncbi:hypothetical protein LAU42_01950 [Macrococcus armenti]|uniref:hypothetical protein n=1 Tax=Macrococcus armenti TaxID=2875764 RepID=UPI001CCEB150|nr:hypothetical protein [Macrococcus armenti]UBH22731.1 hypothetical protein LAU42_01950 [Macrococcus armenti]